MERIIGVIAKLSHSLGEMEEQAKEYFDLKDLTLTQMHYLEVISHLGNPNVTELASELQLTKPTVTVGIDKLIERNYVYKVQSDDDRRNSHLHLTDKGRQINAMHAYAHERFSELIAEALEPNEIETLVQILEKLTVKL
ncbi:MAG: MarR family winged helix-turn-helix transcriptional regulator [Paludibacteraceae bacterium]